MKKIYLTILLIALTATFATAQLSYATIKGHVFNHDTRSPVAGQTIIIWVDSLNSTGYHNKVVTDETGFYIDSIQFNPGSTQIAITASTYECNGTLVTSTAYSYLNSADVTLDFLICSNQPNECVAQFKTQTVSNNLLSLYFMDGSHSSYGDNQFNYLWDFGDGTTSTDQSLLHTFNKPGVYNVCLHIVNSKDSTCSSSFCLLVAVGSTIPGSCENSFWYYNDSVGKQYVFEGSVINGQAVTWTWDFGDGTTATGQKVSHTFSISNNATSSHYVCLKTSGMGADGDSCTFNSCQDIHFNAPSPCENYFKAYSEDGSKYTFSGTVASGATAAYYWDFGDGTTDTGQIVTHAYGKIYTVFNVCLTTIVPVPVSTGFSECKSISCQSLYNIDDSSRCKAVFSTVADSSDNTYRFQNLSLHNYNYAYWNFGDGSQSTDLNPVHTYSSPGLYIACLTIANNTNDCKNQVCQEIWVDINPGCKASFYTFSPDSVTNSVNFMFINTSTEGIYSNLKWSFGDGSESTDFNPVHTYATPGVYTACLTIWDTLGSCQSSYCTEIFAGKVIDDNTVSGIVLAGNKVANQGIVWLISTDNNYNAEFLIDSTGIYHFTGVPYGKYYIYAMLNPGSSEFFTYMPTYYSNSLTWQGATIINAGKPNAWYQVNLVPSMFWSLGEAVITGTISWSGNTKTDANPAANVEVVLYNNFGIPIAYTFTNNEGFFNFNNLPYGEYTLQAEMPGKATQLIPVSLSESSSAVNIDFSVNESAVYILSIDTPNKTKILAGNPYPNPVTDILTLELNVPVPGTATIEVFDMQSRVIHRELTELSIGQNRIRIQTGDFKKGVYQLRIKTDGQKLVQRRFVR